MTEYCLILTTKLVQNSMKNWFTNHDKIFKVWRESYNFPIQSVILILLFSVHQINFLFVAKVAFQCYHFSKQFLSNLSKIKYLAFFITFCCVASLAKMVTLTTNIVYKKSAQYRKYICMQVMGLNLITFYLLTNCLIYVLI